MQNNLVILLLLLGLISSAKAGEGVHLQVNGGKSYQIMEGFGGSARTMDDAHVWSGAHRGMVPRLGNGERTELFNKIYSELGLTRVRYTPDKGESYRDADRYIAHTKDALSAGAEVYFLSPLRLEDGTNESNPEAYVEHAFGVILYWKSKGLELPFYSIINEPGYSRSGIVSKEFIKAAVKLLGKKLKEAGIKTKFVITDDWTPDEAYRRCVYILDDADARQYIGALAYHLYGGSSESRQKIAALSKKYGIPVWMTEFSDASYTGTDGAMNWALAIHGLIVQDNVSAVDYMWAMFGDYSENQWPGNSLIVLKQDSNGLNYRGYQLNSMYHGMAHYSQYVRPGYIRNSATSSDSQVKISAFKKNNSVVLVVLNEANEKKQVDIVLNDLATIKALEAVQSTGDVVLKPLASILKENNRFVMSLPPRSITSFAGLISAQ